MATAGVFVQPWPIQAFLGTEKGNYADNLATVLRYVNRVLYSAYGNHSNDVSYPFGGQTVPTDQFASFMNAGVTALTALCTANGLTSPVTAPGTITMTGATTEEVWITNLNAVYMYAVAVSKAQTVASEP